MSDEHTFTPDDSTDAEKDPLPVFIDAVTAGLEDLRRNHYDKGGCDIAVHVHPSTVKRVVHETARHLHYRPPGSDDNALEEYLANGVYIHATPTVPAGVIAVANGAYTGANGAISIKRLADYQDND